MVFFDLKKILQNPTFYGYVVINILIFIPLGFLFHAGLRTGYGSSLKISGFVVTLGLLITFGMESLQYRSLTRHSSLMDVCKNTIGILLVLLPTEYMRHILKRQAGPRLAQWLGRH